MENFLKWFSDNRKPIGTLVGGLNVILGLSFILQGNVVLATMWTGMGIVILMDAWSRTND